MFDVAPSHDLPFPPQPEWFMDMGVASHAGNNPGILTLSYSPLARFASHITVGNGEHLSPLPDCSILISPNLVKNIISIRKFTHDNIRSVEFDPFGFCEKDLATRAILLRCNIHCDLNPNNGNNSAPPSTTDNSKFSHIK